MTYTNLGWATDGVERAGQLVTAARKFAVASEAKSGESDPAARRATQGHGLGQSKAGGGLNRDESPRKRAGRALWGGGVGTSPGS